MATIVIEGNMVKLLNAKEQVLYRTGTDKDRARLDALAQQRKAECTTPCTLRGLLCQMGCDWGCNPNV